MVDVDFKIDHMPQALSMNSYIKAVLTRIDNFNLSNQAKDLYRKALQESLEPHGDSSDKPNTPGQVCKLCSLNLEELDAVGILLDKKKSGPEFLASIREDQGRDHRRSEIMTLTRDSRYRSVFKRKTTRLRNRRLYTISEFCKLMKISSIPTLD